MSISILIFNGNQIFYPAGVITGKVVCTFNSRKHIRGIFLKLKGEEHTSWTETESYYDSATEKTENRQVTYSGNNKILNLQLNLQGEGKIENGTYEYSFQYILPYNLPSTFKTPNGHVGYCLKANVEIPYGFDYKDEKPITVFSPINFNRILDQIILNPVQYEEESNKVCCCCKAGPITLQLYLPKKAFVLGENITMRVFIKNMSNDYIDRLSVKLQRKIEERCTHPSTEKKTNIKTLLKVENSGVGANQDRNYNIELQIPLTLELPNFELCQLFSVWHILVVKGSIGGIRSDIKMETVITLGHISKVENSIPHIAQVPSAPTYPYGVNFPIVHQPFKIDVNTKLPNVNGSVEIADHSAILSSGSTEKPPPPYNDIVPHQKEV